jgi:uncharacterized membrane protein
MPAMRTHELHPSLVHAPLVLLPAAAALEALAASRPRSRELERAGRTLWWATTCSGLLAGLTGMAASQEIQVDTDHARDLMFVHGLGNLTLVLSALGISVWRSRHHASATSAAAGLVAAGTAIYTAYLGGELVYVHGAGVIRLGGFAAEAPALFSRAAPGRLVRDTGRGLLWLLRRGLRAVSGMERVNRAALGPIAETGAIPAPP